MKIKELHNNYTIEQIQITNNYLNEVYQVVLEQLGNDLEQNYKLNWKTKSYDIFLGDYVLLMTHVLYDRWIGVRNKIQCQNKDIHINIPADYIEFSKWCVENDNYNLQIYNLLNMMQAKKKVQNIQLPDRVEACAGMDNYEFDRRKVLVDNPYFLGGKFNDDEIKVFVNLNCIYQFNCRVQINIVYNINKKFRKENLALSITNFEDACLALCKLYLPVSYLESLTSLMVMKKSLPPKAVYTSIGCYINTPIKFLVAENYNKIPYWIHQHGGGYGMYKICNPEFYERRVATKFFTWGWVEDDITYRLPAKPRIRKLVQDNQVLLKTTLGFKYRQWVVTDDAVYHENIDLTNRTITFLNAIRKDIKLEISHYKQETGINIKQIYDLNNRKYSDKSKPDGAYKIHVCNYLGTSWLESIACGIPTIVFFDKSKQCFRKNVTEIINELIKVGIIHTAPESAAEHLNNVYDDLDKWWESDDLKEVKTKFINRFANFSNDWPLYWQKAFLHNL